MRMFSCNTEALIPCISMDKALGLGNSRINQFLGLFLMNPPLSSLIHALAFAAGLF